MFLGFAQAYDQERTIGPAKAPKTTHYVAFFWRALHVSKLVFAKTGGFGTHRFSVPEIFWRRDPCR